MSVANDTATNLLLICLFSFLLGFGGAVGFSVANGAISLLGKSRKPRS
jgi:hypothetical protein